MTNRTVRGIPNRFRVLLMALFLLVAGVGAEAQTARVDNSGTGQISGRVTDAQTREPLGGVVVRLDRGDLDRAPFRSAITDDEGGYRFEQVPSGRYRLRVERVGYQPRLVEVDLLPGDRSTIGIVLEFRALALPELEIAGPRRQNFFRADGGEDQMVSARVDVARLRQSRYLSGDVRMLTQSDVREAVTLGEPDIFRALQRTPGVTTRDDYTATLWTRGATWDQTRVFLDGLPLYNPTHAGWIFSAVNPDAIGEVAMFPGYRSARWGEGTAAVLDLRSRRGGSDGAFSGVGELSPASLRLALDGSAVEERFRWMIAARRTHVDFLTRAAGAVSGRDDLEVPYDFADLIGRVDGEMNGWGFEVSGIVERDRLRGDVPGLLTGNTGRWGNSSGRGTLRLPIGSWRLPLAGVLPDLGMGPTEARFTAGATSFTAQVDEQSDAVGRRGTLPSIQNLILHRTLDLEIGPTGGDRGRWALGAQMVRDTVSYRGPFSLLAELSSTEDRDALDPYTFNGDLWYGALWGERRISLSQRLSLDAGLRAEFGDSIYNGGYLRLAPRLASRYALGTATLVSAGWSRTYQYTQDVAPAAGPIGPQLHLSAVWVLAQSNRNLPAARSDLSTAGVERWIDGRWLLGASLFHRRATGLKVPNPDSGLVTSGRNPDAVAENTAYGADLSIRKLAGAWTGSLSYSLGRSSMRAVRTGPEGEAVVLRFPSAADVRHAVDLTAMARLSRWRVGGAFTYGSGIPYTELVLPDTAVRSPDGELEPPIVGLPNARRTGAYAGLDLMVDYSRPLGAWHVSVYGQLRNALNRDNAVTYVGSRQCGGVTRVTLASVRPQDIGCDGVVSGVKHNFESGLPRLPLFGIRIAF